MEIAKLWGVERIELVYSKKENYLPDLYKKGTILINEHYVYEPEHMVRLIKTLTSGEEAKVNAIESELNLLREEIDKLTLKKRKLLHNIFYK